jgi:hypothetical protein
VVVAPLVRCNAAGQVGFLGEPERINVLLLRARDGIILIGSASTLLRARSATARKLWGGVLGELKARGAVLQGLPAVCKRHGRPAAVQLDNPSAFLAAVPHGGCTEPCDQTLPCGHKCPLRCHALDSVHARIACIETVSSFCDAGHLLLHRCGAQPGPCQACQAVKAIRCEERQKLRELVSGKAPAGVGL